MCFHTDKGAEPSVDIKAPSSSGSKSIISSLALILEADVGGDSIPATFSDKYILSSNLVVRPFPKKLTFKLVKSVTVHVTSSIVDDGYIEKLEEVCKKNVGDCRLKLVLIDKKENIFLELDSNTYKVNVSNKFIHGLKELPETDMKFN